jgi:hypothetical protein
MLSKLERESRDGGQLRLYAHRLARQARAMPFVGEKLPNAGRPSCTPLDKRMRLTYSISILLFLVQLYRTHSLSR